MTQRTIRIERVTYSGKWIIINPSGERQSDAVFKPYKLEPFETDEVLDHVLNYGWHGCAIKLNGSGEPCGIILPHHMPQFFGGEDD